MSTEEYTLCTIAIRNARQISRLEMMQKHDIPYMPHLSVLPNANHAVVIQSAQNMPIYGAFGFFVPYFDRDVILFGTPP
jgi:hypothetical protein